MANVTNDKIYKLINDVRLELKSDLTGLRLDFTSKLSRLDKLEDAYNELKLQVVELSKDTSSSEKSLTSKFLVLGTIGVILLTAALNFLSLWVSGKLK